MTVLIYLNFLDFLKKILVVCHFKEGRTPAVEVLALNSDLKCPALLTPPGHHHSNYFFTLYGLLYHGGPQQDHNIQHSMGEANFDCGLTRFTRKKHGILLEKFSLPTHDIDIIIFYYITLRGRDASYLNKCLFYFILNRYVVLSSHVVNSYCNYSRCCLQI